MFVDPAGGVTKPPWRDSKGKALDDRRGKMHIYANVIQSNCSMVFPALLNSQDCTFPITRREIQDAIGILDMDELLRKCPREGMGEDKFLLVSSFGRPTCVVDV